MAGLNGKNRNRIRSQSRGKRGAKPKDWQLGDIVTYLPKKMGTAGGIGLVPRRVVCKVVGKTGRGAITYYKLRSNEGVLQARPRAAELDKAVPAAAATINFAGLETDGVPAVTETALARRGLAKAPCSCRKQCGARCTCKLRGVHCSRKCGCKCKVGANCGNH